MKQNVPIDNKEKEQPIQPKRQAVPQPVPIQKGKPEIRQEQKKSVQQQNVQPKTNPNIIPGVAEPKLNENTPMPFLPKTEEKMKQKPRD